MTIINPDQIAYMRAAQGELMPDQATIEVLNVAPDGYGGQSSTWVAVPGTVPCRVMPASGTDTTGRQVAERLYGDASTIITLPAETQIKLGDRVVVAGQRYEVRTQPVGGSMETARQVGADPV